MRLLRRGTSAAALKWLGLAFSVGLLRRGIAAAAAALEVDFRHDRNFAPNWSGSSQFWSGSGWKRRGPRTSEMIGSWTIEGLGKPWEAPERPLKAP